MKIRIIIFYLRIGIAMSTTKYSDDYYTSSLGYTRDPNISNTSFAKSSFNKTEDELLLQMQPAVEHTTRYRFLLSEITMEIPGIPDEDRFIEIRSDIGRGSGKSKKNILDDHMLIVLQGNPLSVVSTVNFNDPTIKIGPSKTFIVIGKGRAADIQFDSIAIDTSSATFADTFTTCIQSPCAVILLQNSLRSELNKLKLKSGPFNLVPTNIDNEIVKQNIILKSAVDIVVFGQSQVRNAFFDKLLESKQIASGSYFVRLFDPLGVQPHLSLNYCSIGFKQFNTNSFKYGLPTPGSANNCNGNVIIPTFIAAVAPLLAVPIQPVIIVDPILPVAWVNPYVKLNQDPSMFKTACASSLPREARYLDYAHLKGWLSVIIEGNHCRFKCHYCSNFFYTYGLRPDLKSRPGIVKPEGTYVSISTKNQEAIVTHLVDNIHVEAGNLMHKLSEAKTQEEYDLILKAAYDAQMPYFIATINVVKSLYFIVKSNNPLVHHPRQIELLQHFGINVGHYQHNDVAARKIASVISDSFHLKLLQSLVRRRVPISVLADESTDPQNISYLVILFQSIEEDNPVIYFYSLIELSEGQTAESMFNSFKDKLVADDKICPGWIEYFKRHLIALISDAASVMVGNNHSWMTLMNEFIAPRSVSLIHCSAHRIHLVLQTAIKSDTRFSSIKKFEGILNKFYTFYLSRGSKRWSHLQLIAEELHEEKPRRLRYVFNVRWAASHFAALQSIYKDYQLLKTDLTAIGIDNTFSDKAKHAARELHEVISDRSFTAVLHEFLDALVVFKELSLTFQEHAGLLIGKSNSLNKGFKKFDLLKTTPGTYLQELLQNCNCRNGCQQPDCTIEEYDNCQDLIYNDNLLERHDSSGIRLSEVRGLLYNAFIIELKERFSYDILAALELLDNKKIKFVNDGTQNNLDDNVNHDLDAYYIRDNDNNVMFPEPSNLEKLRLICAFYFIVPNDCETISVEWKGLLGRITRNPILMERRLDEAHIFWPLALRQENIGWTRLTKNVVYMALSTGNNNAASERAFSVMSNTKTKTRSHLSPEVLESYINIKFNGPELKEFDSLYYTIEFLKKYRRADDPDNLGGRPSQPKESTFTKSKIF